MRAAALAAAPRLSFLGGAPRRLAAAPPELAFCRPRSCLFASAPPSLERPKSTTLSLPSPLLSRGEDQGHAGWPLRREAGPAERGAREPRRPRGGQEPLGGGRGAPGSAPPSQGAAAGAGGAQRSRGRPGAGEPPTQKERPRRGRGAASQRGAQPRRSSRSPAPRRPRACQRRGCFPSSVERSSSRRGESKRGERLTRRAQARARSPELARPPGASARGAPGKARRWLKRSERGEEAEATKRKLAADSTSSPLPSPLPRRAGRLGEGQGPGLGPGPASQLSRQELHKASARRSVLPAHFTYLLFPCPSSHELREQRRWSARSEGTRSEILA